MQLPTLSKVAILCASLWLLACQPRDYDKGIVGKWQMDALYLVDSQDSISREQIRGIIYEFLDNGTFSQSMPDGQELSGKFVINGDTLMLTDTVRNVSYAHYIRDMGKKNLTITVFNSFFNQDMEMQFVRAKN